MGDRVDLRRELDELETAIEGLTASDVERAAETYQHWNPVVASAIDTVPLETQRAMRPVTAHLRSLVSARLGPEVPEEQYEPVVMAAWLHLLGRLTEGRATADILSAPWTELTPRPPQPAG